LREQTFATLAGQFDAHYPLVTIAENDGVGVVSAQPSAKFLVRSFPRQHDCDIEGEVEKQMGAGAKVGAAPAPAQQLISTLNAKTPKHKP